MAKLTDYTSYAQAQQLANSKALWELFDGNREYLNIADECVSRHADGSGRTAVRIAHADGTDEILSFDDIAAGSARFAHWLGANGIQPGDRIAFMLEPSLPFYASLFGAMMMGAISVPLFTLFGLDGLRLRVDDCKKRRDNRALMNEMICTFTCEKTVQELVALLTRHEVPHAPILGIKDALSQPQAVAREMVVETDHPVLGKIPIVNRTITFPGNPHPAPTAPPVLGQHTDEILKEFLGLTSEQIEELRAAKVVA